MKTKIPQWRYEEFYLAKYLGVPVRETETMGCPDFDDAWEFMQIQSYVDSVE
jgi:hypothetical protein